MKHFFIFMCGILPFFTLSQTGVGIGVESPTQALDIQGNLRVRGLSSDRSVMVFALPDGSLSASVPSSGDASAPGIRFIGSLSDELLLSNTTGAADRTTLITLGNEILDVFDEYSVNNNNSGFYVPKANGLYRIFLDYNLSAYANITPDLRISIGVFNNTSNQWIALKEDRYRNTNVVNASGQTRLNSFSHVIYLNLTAGVNYAFVVFADYQDNIPASQKTCRMVDDIFDSPASTFAIEKLK